MSVTPGVRAQLARDGFAHVPAVLDADMLADLRRRVGAVSSGAAPDGPYGILRHNPWPRETTARLLSDLGIVGRVASSLDTERVLLFQDHVVWKPPGTATPVRWHQDYSYWPLATPVGVTVWVALDDADECNGCLHYVPGSQRRGERRPADFVAGATQPARASLPPLALRADDVVIAAPAHAGDVVLHDPLVWHMSPPNLSDRDRRAWSVTLVPAGARWAPEHAPHPYVHELSPEGGSRVEGPRFPQWGAGSRRGAR